MEEMEAMEFEEIGEYGEEEAAEIDRILDKSIGEYDFDSPRIVRDISENEYSTEGEYEEIDNVDSDVIEEGEEIETPIDNEPELTKSLSKNQELINETLISLHSKVKEQSDEYVKIGCTEPKKSSEFSVKIEFFVTDDIDRQFSFELSNHDVVETAVKELAKKINRDPDDITIYCQGRKARRECQFMFLVDNDGVVRLHAELVCDGPQRSYGLTTPYEPNIKVIQVVIERPGTSKKYLEVQIHNAAFVKQWCGGFRNKKTGLEYHNAWTQTRPLERGRDLPPGVYPPELLTRAVQTHLEYKETSINTPLDKSTQMVRLDHYIPSITDRILTAKPYEEFESIQKSLTPLAAVLRIQRSFRSYMCKKKLLTAVKILIGQFRELRNRTKVAREEVRRGGMNLLVKQAFPITRQDFYDLYTILGTWKAGEKKRIKSTLEGPSCKEALYKIFLKELECLYNIETQRIKSKKENLRRKNLKLIEKTSQFMVKKYSKGNFTAIDNIYTQRAREFKEIFASYERTDLSKEERIDVITTFKQILASIEGQDETEDLVRLLDRECHLLILNVQQKKMAGLRGRVQSLFFSMMRNPNFNPQVSIIKNSMEPKKTEAFYRCVGCYKITTPPYFFTHLRLMSYRFCQSCAWMNETANATINLAPYTRLLKTLRESEKTKCCRGAVMFLLQPMGMYYITNVIWNGRSAISGSTNLQELRMTRWKPNEDWTPWNTILLTDDETKTHESIEDPEKFYTPSFVLRIKAKHILARMHFRSVFSTDKNLHESGKWSKVENKEFDTSGKYRNEIGLHKIDDFFKPSTSKIFTPREMSSRKSVADKNF